MASGYSAFTSTYSGATKGFIKREDGDRYPYFIGDQSLNISILVGENINTAEEYTGDIYLMFVPDGFCYARYGYQDQEPGYYPQLPEALALGSGYYESDYGGFHKWEFVESGTTGNRDWFIFGKMDEGTWEQYTFHVPEGYEGIYSTGSDWEPWNGYIVTWVV